MVERNPIILPDGSGGKPCCPKCSSEKFYGRNVQGVILFKCPVCSNQWQGGLPRVPDDPLRPTPPDTTPPPIEQVAVKDKSGNVLRIDEVRNPVSLVPSFKKGAPIPEDGEI